MSMGLYIILWLLNMSPYNNCSNWVVNSDPV